MAPVPGDTVPVGGPGRRAGVAAGRPTSRAAQAVAAAGSLVPVLVAQGLAFALLAASGNMPPLVLRVFRALLTL